MSRIRWPRSFWALAALGALFLLQWFPFTGIFLMLFGAALWTGLLVHVFLLGLAYESLWLRRISPAWLVLPVIAYGGYYALYTNEQLQLAARARELRASNPALVLRYDPKKYSLLDNDAFDLVHTYAVPVAYAQTPYDGPDGKIALDFTAVRLIPRTGNQCNPQHMDVAGMNVVFVFGIKGACVLRMPEIPELPILNVVTKDADTGWKKTANKYHEQAFELWLNGNRLATYRTVTVTPLPPIPILIVGCALADEPSSWYCDADFWRSEQTLDTVPNGIDKSLYDSPESVMLGLHKFTKNDLDNFSGFPENAAATKRANAIAAQARQAKY